MKKFRMVKEKVRVWIVEEIGNEQNNFLFLKKHQAERKLSKLNQNNQGREFLQTDLEDFIEEIEKNEKN